MRRAIWAVAVLLVLASVASGQTIVQGNGCKQYAGQWSCGVMLNDFADSTTAIGGFSNSGTSFGLTYYPSGDYLGGQAQVVSMPPATAGSTGNVALTFSISDAQGNTKKGVLTGKIAATYTRPYRGTPYWNYYFVDVVLTFE